MKNFSSNKKTLRNGEIDFFRFFFAIIVFSFHFEYSTLIFKSGYLGVEFFFLLSGYFLMQYIEKTKDKKDNPSSLIYTYFKNRCMRLYTSYFIVCLLTYVIKCVILSEISIRTVVNRGVLEILLLQSFGFDFTIVILWYVSALMISSVFLYMLSICLKKYFIPIVSFLSFVILVFFYQENQTLNSMEYHFIVSDALLRGIAEMGLGCLLFVIVHKLSRILNTCKKFLFIPKYILFLLILYLMTKESGVKDFSCLIFLFAFVVLLFLDESPIHKLFNNKLCYFLGDISYDLYLNQIIIIYLARLVPSELMYAYPLITFIVFVLIDILLSMITKKISNIVALKMKKR